MRLLLFALGMSAFVHLAVVFLLPRSPDRDESHHAAHVEVGLVEVASHEPAMASPPSRPVRRKLPNKTERATPEARAEAHPSPADAAVGAPTTAVSSAADPSPGITGLAASAGAIPKYVAEVRRRLEAAKVYPPTASAREQQGTVTLGLTIAPDGTITKVAVEAASPYALLNDAALAAVSHMGVLPPRPKETGTDSLHLHVPVVFRIDH